MVNYKIRCAILRTLDLFEENVWKDFWIWFNLSRHVEGESEYVIIFWFPHQDGFVWNTEIYNWNRVHNWYLEYELTLKVVFVSNLEPSVMSIPNLLWMAIAYDFYSAILLSKFLFT